MKQQLYCIAAAVLCLSSCGFALPETDQSKSKSIYEAVDPAIPIPYPLWFSIKNDTARELSAELTIGTVPDRNASYGAFEEIPASYYRLTENEHLRKKSKARIAPGSYNETAWVLPIMELYTDPGISESFTKYRDFMRNKLITFVLEISDGTDTVRVAGWDLPETEWAAHNIAAAGWGLYDTSDWKTKTVNNSTVSRPRLYTTLKDSDSGWDGYPDEPTQASFIRIVNLSEKKLAPSALSFVYGTYSEKKERWEKLTN